jgi:hypothetical protein
MTTAFGPFFFAWTDEPPTGGIAFGPEHQVEDEQIVSFRIDQAEGSLPTLNIDSNWARPVVRADMGVAFLRPGRQAWCHCSSVVSSASPQAYCRKW